MLQHLLMIKTLLPILIVTVVFAYSARLAWSNFSELRQVGAPRVPVESDFVERDFLQAG